MEKKLYIHIGTHKTASTTIQLFGALKDNIEPFHKQSAAYPMFPFRYPHKAYNRNALFLSSQYVDEEGVRHKDVEEANYAQAMQIIHDLFETNDKVILSDERLWINFYRFPRLLKRVLNDSEAHGYRVVLICYLRRQDQLIESWWNQIIKSESGRTEQFMDFANQYPWLDYYKMLSGINETLADRGDFIFRRFSDGIKNGGMLNDFLEQCGIEFTDDFTVPEDANSGMYGNTVRIKQLLNEIDALTWRENRLFRESFTRVAGLSKKYYNCSEFNEEERREFMGRFEEGNQALADQFFHDGRPLFSDDYTSKEKREDYNPLLIDDVIRTTGMTDILLYQSIEAIKERERRQNALFRDQIKDLQEKHREVVKVNKEQRKEIKRLSKIVEKHERRIENLRHPFRALLRKIKALFGGNK